jgi:hypothetical protein
MQANNKYFFMKKYLAFLWLALMITPACAGTPLWIFEPLTATTISVPVNGTAIVQYRVTNQSSKPHTLIMQSIGGITQITTGVGICGNPFVLPGKGSCVLSLEISGNQLSSPIMSGPVVCQQGNLNQCYRPSSTNNLNITRASSAIATISVNPTTLLFAENSTGNVTVTNSVGSSVPAENVVATIPGGSNISVQSTNCGASLGIGQNCTITFASASQEGPTTIPVAGDNTNTVNVDVTVTSQPQISITNPVQQNRVVTVSSMIPLSLDITNDVGSVVNANAITVSNKADCLNLSVDDSNCTSVAPGDTCTLELTSNSPYVPCTITVSGSNTANSPTTLIAFSHLGGLVFEESAGSGKVVIDAAQGFNSQWTSAFSNIAGASSLDNGVANTNAIVADTACSNDTANCAAQRCRGISADWYLPARDELSTVHGALCSNLTTPCDFGGFSLTLYWSSSQNSPPSFIAWGVFFPTGLDTGDGKSTGRPVRCVRAFTP